MTRRCFLCLCGLLLLTAAGRATATENDDAAVEHKRKLLGKYSPGYVAATMADAFAEMIRSKAKAKYNKTEVLPQPQPSPSKEKEFAYTSIRLKSSEQNAAPTPAPTLIPFTNSQVAVSGPRGSGSVDSPLVTQQVSGQTQPFVTAQSDDVNAKMQALEEEMQQLAKMKEEMEALKREIEAEKNGESRRRLLDSGLPGWDPGTLLEKKLDILSEQARMLQEKINRDAWELQESLGGKVDHSTGVMDTIGGYVQDRIAGREDLVRETFDSWKENVERNAGNLQDALGNIMDLRAKKFEKLLGM